MKEKWTMVKSFWVDEKTFPFTTTPICTWLFTAAFSFFPEVFGLNYYPSMIITFPECCSNKLTRLAGWNRVVDSPPRGIRERTSLATESTSMIHFKLPHRLIDWLIDWMIIDPFQFTAPPARPNVILYDSNIVISQHACWRNCITRSSICVRQIYLVAAQW